MRKTALRMILIILIIGMFTLTFNAGLDCVYAPKPPTITNVNVLFLPVTIHWETDVPATSQVEYGKTIDYNLNTPLNDTLDVIHRVRLNNLEPETTYHVRVGSQNEFGNETVSDDHVFETTSFEGPLILNGVSVDLGNPLPTVYQPLQQDFKDFYNFKNICNHTVCFGVSNITQYPYPSQHEEAFPLIWSYFKCPSCIPPGEVRRLHILWQEKMPVGEHNITISFNLSVNGESATYSKNYTVCVLDPTNITGDIHIDGTVVDENDNPVPYACVLLFSNFSGRLPTATDEEGKFSFDVPPIPSDYFLFVASHEESNFAPATTLVDLNASTGIKLVLPSNEPGIHYKLIKTETTNMGFWEGDVSDNEQFILLAQGQEQYPGTPYNNSYISPEMVNASLMLFTIDGNKVWEYPLSFVSWAADLSADGAYAAYATLYDPDWPDWELIPGHPEYGEVGVLNATTGTSLWKKNINTDNFPQITEGRPVYQCRDVEISHNNQYVTVGLTTGEFYLLDLQTGDIIWKKQLSGMIRSTLFSADDKYVYVGASGWLYKLSTADGSLIWRTDIFSWPFCHYGLQLSPDESCIAAGVKTGQVSLIRTSDGEVLWWRDTPGLAAQVRFSKDGNYIFTWSGGGPATIFDINGTRVWKPLTGGPCEFSQDGYVLAQSFLFDPESNRVSSFESPFGEQTISHFVYLTKDKSRAVIAQMQIFPDTVGIAFYQKCKDITAPAISILSPENKTYSTSSIPLTFTVSELTSWIGYGVDGEANVTVAGNTTLTSLFDGLHYVVICANDTAGNMGASSTVYFTVDTTPPNITDVSQFPLESDVLPEDEVQVNATVTDDLSEVKQVTLNYTNGNGTWITVEMANPEGNIWNATIPAFPYCTYVNYTIVAEDNVDNIITTKEVLGYQYHVIPELPSFLILPLFMIVTLLAVIAYRRKTVSDRTG